MFLDAYGMPIYSLYQFVPVPFQQSMEVLKAVLDSLMGHCRSLRSGVALSDALVPPYTPEEVDACEVYACSRHVGSALPVKSWKMRVKLFMQYSCSKVLALNLVISIRFVHFFNHFLVPELTMRSTSMYSLYNLYHLQDASWCNPSDHPVRRGGIYRRGSTASETRSMQWRWSPRSTVLLW